MVRKGFLKYGFLVYVTVCLGLIYKNALAKPVLIDGILAVVNGEIITLSDLALQESRLYSEESESNDLASDGRIKSRESTLQDLIDERLIIMEAERIKMAPDEEEIKNQIEQIKLQNGFLSDGALDAALAKDGLTRKDLEKNLYEEISLLRMHQKIQHQNNQVLEQEIREYYDKEWSGEKEGARIELSHILLKDIEGDPSEKKDGIQNKAREIIRLWEEGESFPKLASKFSEDASGSEAGYLGWFYIKDLRPEFVEAIQNVHTGKIAGPVQTEMGYHILFVSQRKTSELDQGTPVWERIKEILIERKRADFYKTWIERLRRNATIEIHKGKLSWYQ